MPRKPASRLLTTAMGLVALVAAVASATAQNTKFAVINTERVLLESETGKTALAGLRALQEQKENEMQAKQQELAELRKRLSEGATSLSQETLQQLQADLETGVRDLRRMQEDANRELQKRQDEVLREIEQKVAPVVNQLGREGGYSMIFRKFQSGLIYVDDALDITAQVIQRLDSGN